MKKTIWLHRRQFALTKSDVSPIPGWATQRVGEWVLHTCPDLPVVRRNTSDGYVAILIGIAVQMIEGMGDPEDLLQRRTAFELEREYRSWSGRWLLIVKDCLHLDATGNLGVFYSARKGGLVSSSLALASQITEQQGIRRELVYSVGIDWYAGPKTRLLDTDRLLPSQVLRLSDLQLLPRKIIDDISVDASAGNLSTLLSSAVRALQRRAVHLYLPLTAGLDSRTLLAVCFASGVRPITYTLDSPGMKSSDRTLPPLLARSVGLTHRFFSRQHFSLSRRLAFERHSFGQCVDIDRVFFAYGQHSQWRSGDLVLGGGCWEFGRGFYYKHVPQDFDLNTSAAHRLLHGHLAVHAPLGRRWFTAAQPTVCKGLDNWLRWVRCTPQPDLDFRDRLYLEQRLGCWLSSIEQALDITSATRVHIANSHMIFNVLNVGRMRDRLSGQLQKDIIARCAPQLLKFDFNEPDSYWMAKYKRVAKYSHMLLAQILRY